MFHQEKTDNLCKSTKEGVTLEIKVIPRANRSEIVGILDERLKIKVKSPPVDGKANKEIIKFFSSFLGIPKKDIEILRGTSSSHKTIIFRGRGEEIEQRIRKYLKERRE